MKPIICFLTCADETEAMNITRALLEKKLSSCIKRWPVDSGFLWKNEIDTSNEVMLAIDSFEEKFASIEAEVKKLHSYEQFVLLAVPVVAANKGTLEWMKKSCKS